MKRIYEDLFDELDARQANATSQLTSEIDNEKEYAFPEAKNFDLLFRINFDASNEMKIFKGRKSILSMYSADEVPETAKIYIDEINQSFRSIKDDIYELAEQCRFIEDISEVLITTLDEKMADNISELSTKDCSQLGYDFYVDRSDDIKLIFAIRCKENSNGRLKQTYRFLRRLFAICNHRVFNDNMSLKLGHVSIINHWQIDNKFVIWKDCFTFVEQHGNYKTVNTEELYSNWYYIAKVLYHYEEERVLPAIEDILYLFPVSQSMFVDYIYKSQANSDFDYQRDSELIWKYLRKGQLLDLTGIVKYALDSKRNEQYKVMQYIFYPRYKEDRDHQVAYSADPSECKNAPIEVQQYIENLN